MGIEVSEVTDNLDGRQPLFDCLPHICQFNPVLLSSSPCGCSWKESGSPLEIILNNGWSGLIDVNLVRVSLTAQIPDVQSPLVMDGVDDLWTSPPRVHFLSLVVTE